MQIHVKLYGGLRDHIAAEKRGRTTIDLADGATVADLLQQLGIDRPIQFAVNGKHGQPAADDQPSTDLLAEGDTVTLFELAAGG